MPKTDPKDVEAKQIPDSSVTPETKGEENQGPTIVMTGVSGKKITADVKVVKVKKAKRRPAEPDASTGADPAPATTPTPVPAPVVEKSTTPEQSVGAKKEPQNIEAKQPKAEETVGQVSAAPAVDRSPKQAPAASSETVSTKPVETKPAASQETTPVQPEAKAPVQPSAKVETAAPAIQKKSVSTPAAEQPVAKTEVSAPKPQQSSKPATAPASRVKETPVATSKPAQAEKPKPAPKAAPVAQATEAKTAQDSASQGVAGTKVDPAKSSLAATAAYFAARAAARKKAAEQRIQQVDQRSGSSRPNKDRRDGGTARPPRAGGGGYSGGGAGRFAKDKDEEPKLQSHSRTPARKPSPIASEILGNPKESSRSAFAARGDRKGDRRTDRRDFDNRRNSRGGRRFNGGDDEFSRGRRRQNRKRDKAAVVIHAVLTNISLPAVITVKEFAEAIKKTSAEVIKALMKFGVMATLNQEIDYDTASIIANEFGIKTERLVEVTEEDILFDDSDDTDEDLQVRPPVVCVMGHVDHGKTSLLDRIRSTEVAHGEAGGITQHIGAYMVDLNGRKITFLDTPGHEAFTTMRARGAQATDIAILVVAADDGVMPQTIEAINHAKAANTQIIVAINKMDRPGANADRVKEELAKYELISEEWGGSTTMVPVSAKTGEGIEELLEMVLLTADILDLKANPDRQAKGIVIEAKLDKQRGPVATLLVQRGTLHVGDTVVMGESVGRVRAMTDAKGANRQEAGPSVPVEIIGIPDVPGAGEIFYQVENEKVARQLAEKRRVQNREKSISGSSRMSLENLFSQMASGEVKELNLIIKADVQGSVEAVNQAMLKLSNDEVKVKIVHSAVGAITESDLNLAEVANAIVIGFNVRPSANVADQAKANGIDLRLYRVIYQAIEDVEAAMKGLLAPKLEVVELGQVEIRQVFKASNIGTIGGGYVTHGKIVRNSKARLVRDGVQIWEGGLASLKRFKDDVREVAQGYECGISLENYNDIKEGDVIEAYTLQEVERD